MFGASPPCYPSSYFQRIIKKRSHKGSQFARARIGVFGKLRGRFKKLFFFFTQRAGAKAETRAEDLVGWANKNHCFFINKGRDAIFLKCPEPGKEGPTLAFFGRTCEFLRPPAQDKKKPPLLYKTHSVCIFSLFFFSINYWGACDHLGKNTK